MNLLIFSLNFRIHFRLFHNFCIILYSMKNVNHWWDWW